MEYEAQNNAIGGRNRQVDKLRQGILLLRFYSNEQELQIADMVCNLLKIKLIFSP